MARETLTNALLILHEQCRGLRSLRIAGLARLRLESSPAAVSRGVLAVRKARRGGSAPAFTVTAER
jgi:2-methylcitrate dehydratase PrpD